MKTTPPGKFAPVLPTRGLPRRTALSAVAGTLSGITVASHAQTATDWPNQAVRYINLFPPGGATDALSRIYCAKMSDIAGQQFVVENRSGSGGVVGTDAIAKSRPDGYTIGLSSIASQAIAPTLYLNDTVNRWKTIVGVEPARYVEVMDLGFRWASCGSQRTLNFHWRIMQLPPQVIDYVVIHELTHLKVPDHSPKFWRELGSVDI